VRVKTGHIKFLKRSIKKYLPDAAIYLIGSKEVGEQKLDIVSTKRDDRSIFKEIALLDSVKL
jgi:hypothetical protein